MASSSRSAERFKYGICLNDECSLCKEKKVQQIPMRKDLVCSECGKPLRECPPPKKKGIDPKLIGIIAAVVIIGGGIAAFFGLKGGNDAPPQTPPVNVVDSDSIKRAEAEALRIQDSLRAAAVKDSLKKVAAKDNEKNSQTPTETTPPTSRPKDDGNGYGKVNLGYGVYTGDRKNGKPHGHGTIKYTARHKIVPSKDFEANPGDEFEGDFREGRVSGNIGYWKHDGNVTGIKP